MLVLRSKTCAKAGVGVVYLRSATAVLEMELVRRKGGADGERLSRCHSAVREVSQCCISSFGPSGRSPIEPLRTFYRGLANLGYYSTSVEQAGELLDLPMTWCMTPCDVLESIHALHYINACRIRGRDCYSPYQ